MPPKIYVCTPARQPEHNQYLKEVNTAMAVACAGYRVVLGKTRIDRKGWQAVVDAYNEEVESFLKSDCKFMFSVESDVVVPANAVRHMLSLNADVASGLAPYHYDSVLMHPSWIVYKDLMVCGYFQNPEDDSITVKPGTVHRESVVNKLFEGAVYTGTGCFLVHRRVFEARIRFHRPQIAGLEGAAFDLQFWKDIYRAGFRGVLDGFVICKHLGI